MHVAVFFVNCLLKAYKFISYAMYTSCKFSTSLYWLYSESKSNACFCQLYDIDSQIDIMLFPSTVAFVLDKPKIYDCIDGDILHSIVNVLKKVLGISTNLPICIRAKEMWFYPINLIIFPAGSTDCGP